MYNNTHLARSIHTVGRANAFKETSMTTEPFVVHQPLTARLFRQHIGADGRVRLAILVSLDELYDCRGIDGFNDLADARINGAGVHGCLTDMSYRPLRVAPDERVLIEVDAATEDLELDGSTTWRCRLCGEVVDEADFRKHLCLHNPNAQGMEFVDVAAQYESNKPLEVPP